MRKLTWFDKYLGHSKPERPPPQVVQKEFSMTAEERGEIDRLYSISDYLAVFFYFLTIDFAVLSVICFFQDIRGLKLLKIERY